MLKGDVFEYQEFENQIFALFIDLFMNKANGVARTYKNGMNLSYSGHTVTIDSGACLVQGRFLEEDSSTTIDAGIETSFCKLVVEIDLDKTNTIETFNQGAYKIVKDNSAYPSLTQQDTVGTNTGKYQYELARFKISDGVVTEFSDRRTFIEDELQYGAIDALIQIVNNNYNALNSAKASNNHASSSTTYGLGTTSNYGHCKLANNLTTGGFANGLALSANQGKILNDKFSNYLLKSGGTLSGTLKAKNIYPDGTYSLGGSNETNRWNHLYVEYVNAYLGMILYNGNLTVESGNIRTEVGNIYIDNGSINAPIIYEDNTVTNSPNMYITSNGWIRRTTNTSSKRYKKDIKDIKEEELNPERLYDLKVKQFKYKKEYQPSEKDKRYDKNLVGFIAEDVAEIYPIAADFNENGEVDNWNERYLIPAMLDLIQKQNERIKALEAKVGVENE